MGISVAAVLPAHHSFTAEFDEKKRDEALRKIALYYHENAPALWLEESSELSAVSKKVKNYENINWQINYTDIEMTR